VESCPEKKLGDSIEAARCDEDITLAAVASMAASSGAVVAVGCSAAIASMAASMVAAAAAGGRVGGARDVQFEVASRAAVVPHGQVLVAGRAYPRRGEHEEIVLRMEMAASRLRELRAKRVHVEGARDASVHEAPRGALPQAEVAEPPTPTMVAGCDAPQREGVPRVREEGDGRLEVVGARVVDVDVAGVAVVAAEACREWE